MPKHQESRRVTNAIKNERGFVLLLIWPIIIFIAECCAIAIARMSTGMTW